MACQSWITFFWDTLYNNQTITQKQYIKLSGVYIDEHLSWKEHINYICNKIAKSVGIIYRSRYLLSSATRLSLYNTLIYPYLTYCNIVWSSTFVTNLNRILFSQKRVVHILTNSEYRAHSDPLFKQLKILDIFKLNTFHIGKFMFLYHHCMLPTFFDNLFTIINQIHGCTIPDLPVTIDLMVVELILSSSPSYTQDWTFGILYLQI